MLVVILVIALVACAVETQTQEIGTFYRKVDYELEPYVAKFETEWGKQISFKVTMEITPHPSVGHCQIFIDGSKIVRVHPDYFRNSLNDLQKEQLVFHELGHCALGRFHTDSQVQWNDLEGYYPASIMSRKVFNDWSIKAYEIHKDYYLKELFER